MAVDRAERGGAGIAWGNVFLAAVLMLATVPGRTFGLGLINEQLLAELGYGREAYAVVNFWATSIGAAFCLPIGWLLDRCGLRWVSTALVLLLGAVVWRMSSYAGSLRGLFVLILFTRGFGQSALSVASITTVGKSSGARSGLAMGVFSALFTVLMIAAFEAIGATVRAQGWRPAWAAVAGGLVFGVAPLAAFFIRETKPGAGDAPEERADAGRDHTLREALGGRAFWIFGGAIALFGLAVSGLTFWNEKVVQMQGFDEKVAVTFIAWVTGFGLLGQFGCGWLSKSRPLPRLLAVAMGIYACALGVLPHLKSAPALLGGAALFGLAGGAVTVVFFAIWGAAFGRAQLGRIQGAAQLLTVLASAIGPWLFEKSLAEYGSYGPVLDGLAVLVLGFAVACWGVRIEGPARR